MKGDKPPQETLDPHEQAFSEFKEKIKKLLSEIDVKRLTKSDFQYFGIWEIGGLDKRHTNDWKTNAGSKKSSLALIAYCEKNKR